VFFGGQSHDFPPTFLGKLRASTAKPAPHMIISHISEKRGRGQFRDMYRIKDAAKALAPFSEPHRTTRLKCNALDFVVKINAAENLASLQ
jgi:hypothetical protein